MPYCENHLTARDGLPLFTRRWLPEGEPRADVLVVHGFVEHSGRYAPAAVELNRRGYAVHAMDLRGHGRSEGPRCFVRSFDQYVDDLAAMAEQVEALAPGRSRSRGGEQGDRSMFSENVARTVDANGPKNGPVPARPANGCPDRPRFVLAHSLGGLVAVSWCLARQPRIEGLMLSGPLLRLGDNVFPLLRRLAGFVGRWFPRVRIARMGCRYLSRDPAVVEQFRTDPLVFHDRFPARTGSEILRAVEAANRRMEELSMPLLVLQGTGDRVCDPEGSRELCRRAGSADKTLRLFDGLYHDLLHEPERGQVIAEILDWLDARC